MKNLKYKWLLLSVILSMATISTMKAIDFTGGRIYFDNLKANQSGVIQLCARQSSYTGVTTLNNISNTKLYYNNSLEGSSWGGFNGTFIIANGSAWNNGNFDTDNGDLRWYTAKNTSYSFNNASGIYLIAPTSSTKGTDGNYSYLGTASTVLNYTQTIKYAVSTNGATATELTTGYVPANIAISSYKFVAGTYNSVSSSSANKTLTKNGSNYNATVTAARTATTTYTVSNIDEDYTFLGWYTAASGGTELSTSNTYTYYPTAATTVYARFSHENNHSVTISNYCTSTTSTISSSSQNIGEVTYSAIDVPVIYGYTFTNWTYGNGISVKDGDTNTSNPIHVKTLSSGTYSLTANYTEDLTSTWYVAGAAGLFGGWGSSGRNMQRQTGHSTEKKFYYTIDATKVINGDASDSDLEFKIYNSDGGSYCGNSGYWVTRDNYQPALSIPGGSNMQFRPDAYGTYEFKLDCESPNSESAPKLIVTFGTKRKVTFGKRTGGKTVTAKYKNSVSMTSNQYVIDGGSVTFAQTANTGYTFAGWYNASSGGSKVSDDATYTTSITGGDKTVYSTYTENISTITINTGVHGTVTGTGEHSLGVATKQAITATPDEGYYFAGWEVTGNAVVEDASASSTNVKADGTDGGEGTITANFVELEKIYFRNIFDDGAGNVSRWSNVYVYFAITWDGGRVVTNSDASYKVAMTKIAGTDVYWAYVPRSFTTYADADLKKQVAFSDASYGTSYKFYHATASHDKAASRGDYNKALNMFVPHHIAKSTNTGNGGVDYFDNGYWMKYDTRASQGAGYYLKKYNSRNNYTQEGEFIATNDDADFIQFELRIDAANSTLNYMITSAGALNYVAASGVTAANCSNIALNENTQSLSDNDVKFSLKTASEGIYTFILDQSGDKMKLNVIYPVAVGDYVLIHDYNDGSAKSNHSDFIKASEVSGKTVSMYLNMDAGTKSLKLYKCTAITAAGKPVFGSSTTVGTGTGLFNTTTFDKGKGVYQFNVTIEEDEVATITNAGLYEGNYYIKTNCATGGWANYKQNIMVENSINASDFDYYYCKWVGDAGTNIKCVIANDYNNAVSDTLIGDATLGVGVQTLPRAGSVRFSYNSKTNTLDRAYISGSSDWETYFLELQAGSAVIKQRNGSAFTNNKTKFTDGGNWIYSLELQAQEGARIKLVSHYYTGSTTKSQYFKGASGDFSNSNTEELIGDNGDATTDWQQLTIIYDFKTNNILSAWSPSGEITGTINLKTDVMLIHNRKKIANPAPTYVDEVSLINFTGSYQLQNIDKVYSAFRFQKLTGSTDYVGLQETSANDAQSYYRYNYWISFPYDVKMTDIFGINGYGSKWRIQYYDGEERASKGWYKGDGVTSFWKTMPMSEDKKLNKGEGYVLQLSPSAFKATGSGSLWELSDEVYLYFPSKSNFGNIAKNTSSVTLSELNCTKGDFTDGSGKSHNVTDSHWHVFGIPTFNDATGTTGTGHNYYDESEPEDEYPEDHNISGGIFYFYKYNNTANSSEYNTYTATSSEDFTFQPMHAYMIQMHGTLNFASNSVPASVAARQLADDKNYDAQIEILSDDIVHDQTFISMKDEAEVGFAFNEDLMKIHNDGKTNIYSYSGPYDVAANILPAESRTIALGVEVAEEGTYTFHMPSNFSGTVTLFDNVTNTRTNLALSDYEVSLNAGNHEGRFYLEIDLRKVTTSIDGLQGEGIKDIRKVMIDDIMYIIRDGKMYDARGARVE